MARPVGSTTRPQFHTYVTEIERKEFALWVKENFKKDPALAKWYGDQMFGKATQPVGFESDKPLLVQFDNAFTPTPKGNSK